MKTAFLVSIAEFLAWFILAVCLIAIASAVAHADEPPQCNLPGWQTVKADICKCGVSCDCADPFCVCSVATKAPAAKKDVTTAPAKAQGPSYAIERRYKKIGNRLFVEDVLVEVTQPATLSYAAVPTQAVNYQSPKMDCSSGTCRYVR